MLRERERFEAIQRSGQVRAQRLLVVRFTANDGSRTRWAFSTSKRIGGSVIRNRIRRRLREGAKEILPRIQEGWDIMIIARPESADTTSKDLHAAMAELLLRGGLLKAEVE